MHLDIVHLDIVTHPSALVLFPGLCCARAVSGVSGQSVVQQKHWGTYLLLLLGHQFEASADGYRRFILFSAFILRCSDASALSQKTYSLCGLADDSVTIKS